MVRKPEYVIVGSGAGGGTIALELERKGKEALVLERGLDMP
jgi:choline dehydrogenase-like flavoprotein